MIDRFLVWWCRNGRYSWSRLRRRCCESRYLSYNLPTVGSLEEIESCLRQVTWTMDGPLHLFDCISYPQLTWTKKKDDCDGFASLAAALLIQLSIDHKPVLLTAMVRPFQSSHTVCAFSSPQGRVWFFDNYYLRYGEWQKYAEVVAEISKPPLRLVCWDVRNPTTLELIEFHEV